MTVATTTATRAIITTKLGPSLWWSMLVIVPCAQALQGGCAGVALIADQVCDQVDRASGEDGAGGAGQVAGAGHGGAWVGNYLGFGAVELLGERFERGWGERARVAAAGEDEMVGQWEQRAQHVGGRLVLEDADDEHEWAAVAGDLGE